MPVPELVAATGRLPLGRYQCTEEEIKRAFVEGNKFSSSTTRPNIWNDWETARETIMDLVPVHSVWIAGSFTTSKLDPGDIDVVFIVNGTEYERLGDTDRSIVAAFGGGSAGAAVHGLQIDSYILPWICLPMPTINGSPGELHYFAMRGYWDDWWLRARTGPKDAPPVPADTIPRRGYLEVQYHEYLS